MRFILTEETQLLEGKNLEQTVNQYIDKYKKLVPAATDEQHRAQVMGIIEIDPTYKENTNTTGDYAIWLLNIAIKNGWDVIDTKNYCEPVLLDFIEKKSRLKNKDINSYKTVIELRHELDKIELSDRQKERKARNATSMTKKVLSTEHWDIYAALNWEGALTLGKGTRWCTAQSEDASWYVKYVYDYHWDDDVEAYEVRDCKKHGNTVEELINYPEFYIAGGRPELTTEEDIYRHYSDHAVFLDVVGEGLFVNPYNETNVTDYNTLYVLINKETGAKYQFLISESLAEMEDDLEYAISFCNAQDQSIRFREFIGWEEKELRQFWTETLNFAMQDLFYSDPDEEEEFKESLTEGIEDMKKYYPNVSDNDFQRYIEMDPTYKPGSDKAGTYAKWILTLANKGDIDNIGHLKDLLTRFEQEKKNLKDRDIMKYKSVQEVEDMLNDDDSYKQMSSRQRLRQTQDAVHNVDISKEAEHTYSDDTWDVYVPLTYEASCKLGRNTRWCTASTEDRYYYDSYTGDGDQLHICINKKTGEKFQFHFESNSYMNAEDEEISYTEFFFNNPGLYQHFRSELDDYDVEIIDSYRNLVENDFIWDCRKFNDDGGGIPIAVRENIKKVIIPSTWGRIPNYYFEYAEKLEEVIIEEGVTQIGASAFHSCVKLKSIQLPISLEEIQDEAFCFCPALESIDLTGIRRIGNNVFYQCESLTNITVPNVEDIGESTFHRCSKLKRIEWHSTTIPWCACYKCEALEYIVIGPEVEVIGGNAFGHTGNNMKIFIPDTVKIIHKYAFAYNEGLTLYMECGKDISNKNFHQDWNAYVDRVVWNAKRDMNESYAEVSQGWTVDTCHPSYAKKYSDTNPTAGQCAVTAMYLNQKYGYDIYDVLVGKSRHFFNKDADGNIIDYTADQFKTEIPYENARKREFKDLYRSCNYRYGLYLNNLSRGLNESLIVEDIDAVKKNYPNIADEDFMTLVALDPTYDPNRDSVGTYGKWILNLYNKGKITYDDFDNVTQMLDVWETNKRRFQNKDIGQFKTLKDFETALLDMPDLELSHRQKVRQAQKNRKNADLGDEAKLVYEDSDWEVWIPKTYAASCKLGQGTSWCTATTETDNHWKEYSSSGDLYIVINKHQEEEKYQFHFESNSFMNRDDYDIDLIDMLDRCPGLDGFFTPILLADWGYPNAKPDTEVELWFDEDCIRDCLEYADGKWNCVAGETALQFIYEPDEYFNGFYYEGFFEDMFETAIDCMDEDSWKEVTRVSDITEKDELLNELRLQESRLYDAFIEAIQTAYEFSAATTANNDAIAELENAAVYCRGINADYRDSKLYVTGTMQDMMRIFHAYHTELNDIDRGLYDNYLQVAVATCIKDNYALYKPDNDDWGVLEDEEFNQVLQRCISEWFREEDEQ